MKYDGIEGKVAIVHMVDACLWLVSDGASWVTGQVVNVDGGQIRRP